MNSSVNKRFFNKTILSGAISSAILGVGLSAPLSSQADIYEFTFSNSGCTPGLPLDCGDAGDGVFTILDAAGKIIANSSEPYYSDATWTGGVRTQIGGSITIKETDGATQGKGVSTINDFDFFNGGPAQAQGVTFVDIGDGSGTLGTVGGANEQLWLGQMLFNWNGNNGIPVSIVWDMQGLLDNLAGLNINNIADPANVIGSIANDLNNAVGIEPGSDGLKKGSIAIGPAPVATSTLNTTSLCTPSVPDECLGTNPSGDLPLITDALSIGGSPMIDGPFKDASANFDIAKLTLSGYNDTTAPVLTIDGLSTGTVNLSVGDSFDANNPGVTVTCTDAADGVDDLVTPLNANISFTVDDGNGGTPVDTGTAGNYEVLYTCTDNASARAALADDPDNPGNATIPADNTSVNTTVLSVNVAAAGQPVITITNGSPTAHEACTLYTDAGATAVDSGGAPIAPVIPTDNDGIDGTSPNEMVPDPTIDYDISDGGTPAVTQTRTVVITDSVAPAITITGGPAVTIESSEQPTYMNPTATAVDGTADCNPVVGGVATTTDTVNFMIPDGTDSLDSTLRYFASDTSVAANQTQEDQVVTVVRSEPVITIIGGGVVIGVGDTYVEQGMDIHDVQDGDLTGITATGMSAGVGAGMGILDYTIDASAVDTNTPGNYPVTYDVTDSDGNLATQVTRNVAVGGFASGGNFSMLDSNGNVFGGTNDVFFDWDGASVSIDEEDTDQFDGTTPSMTIASVKPQPFFSFVWDAHHIRTFGQGTYTFDTTCTVAQLEAGLGSVANPCDGPLDPGQDPSEQFMTMTVGMNQIGAHILFDWNTSTDIDVLNVWDYDGDGTGGFGVWDRHGGTGQTNKLWDGQAGVAPLPTTTWRLVSTDIDGDNINASPMFDGPFQGSNANFNAGPAETAGLQPPYVGSAPDTDIGSGFASMSIWGMLAGFVSLLGFRRFNKKDKQ